MIRSLCLAGIFFVGWIASSHANTIYDNQNAAAVEIVQAMSLSEKIGQMLLPAIKSLTTNYAPKGMEGAKAAWGSSATPPIPSKALGDALGFQAITTYKLGGLLQAGGPLLYSSQSTEGQRIGQWQALAATAQLYKTGGLNLLLGTDGIHGNQHVVGTILFPHNIGLGATHNPSLVNAVAQWTAFDIASSGFNWTYMPTVSVGHDYRWGRFYESYSSNKDVVRALAQNAVAGFQRISNGTTGKVSGVLACAKHFIGDGDTQNGVDEGDTYATSLNSFWKENGAGYEGAVALSNPIAEVGSIMASYNSLNGIPMHFGGDFNILSRFRNEGIQFQGKTYKLSGFVVSDYDGIARAAWKYNVLHKTNIDLAEALAMSINAGVDMIMMSAAAYTNPFDPGTFVSPKFQNKSALYYTNLQDVITALKTAVNKGLISISRIDDAVTRIVRTKLAMNFTIPRPPAGPSEATISLNAAEQSLMLLKNTNATVPRRPEKIKFVFLMGDYDDIGRQNGGWTINWQGQAGNKYWTSTDRVSANATSILDGIKNTVLAAGSQIVTGATAVLAHPLGGTEGPTKANSVAIIAISEFPYAEFIGDVANQNPWYEQGVVQGANVYAPRKQNPFLRITFTDQQMRAIAYLKNAGIPVITVLFSGRPIVISETTNAPLAPSDAFIAAFLPGTSGGQAVANVIFGSFVTKSVTNVINGKTYYSNTLPFAWPSSMEEVVNHTPTLFPEGFGL